MMGILRFLGGGVRRLARTARPRSPLWKVTVSPWWAKVLIAGGARRGRSQ